MIGWLTEQIDTPALVIDLTVMEANIERNQAFAEQAGVRYRPHSKTHKMLPVAHQQIRRGAQGITVAKLGEAEVMAAAGINDIFIANQIVGEPKLRRLEALSRRIKLAVGLDNLQQAMILSRIFAAAGRPLEVMIEVNTGHNRAGLRPDQIPSFCGEISPLPGLSIRGLFTYEGHIMGVSSRDEMLRVAGETQRQLAAAARAVAAVTGRPCAASIGSTLALRSERIEPGITELRSGTCVFNDSTQAQILGHTDWCAATVLATISSAPDPDRVVIDAGSKALSSDQRPGSLLRNEGFGRIKGVPGMVVTSLSEEHGVLSGPGVAERLPGVGSKVEVIPNHICAAVNLFDQAYGIRNGRVEAVWPVAARGRSQ
ncbi:MAG: alanine racemase [Thermaerobacterales bacterium]